MTVERTTSTSGREFIGHPVPKAVMDTYLKQRDHKSTPSTFEKNCWQILRMWAMFGNSATPVTEVDRRWLTGFLAEAHSQSLLSQAARASGSAYVPQGGAK